MRARRRRWPGRAMGVGMSVAGRRRAGGRGQVLTLNPHNYGSFSLVWWRRVDCASYRLCVSPSPEFLGWLSPSPPQA